MLISNKSPANTVHADVLDPRNILLWKKFGMFVPESSRQEDDSTTFVVSKQGNSWQEPLHHGRHLKLKYQGKLLESLYFVHKSRLVSSINWPTALCDMISDEHVGRR
jgi:hypothetical protein